MSPILAIGAVHGKRSSTDFADNDSNMMDALEVARAQDVQRQA
jgi:hypothetical protein